MSKFYFFTTFSFILNFSICKSENLTLKIAYGNILGTLGKTQYNENTYHAYKGIKYADAERFEPAIPVKQWNGVYNATFDKPTCIQLLKTDFPESDDCLYLNVYIPKNPNTPPGLLPVMFWIHGGFFLFGDSLYTNYGPDYLLDDNVIVVTINYRLGIFGFLSTGDSTLPGNLALKDLVLGLQWVQNNIRFFGGDPKNVTIFGESAGAALTSYLTLSPLTQGKGYFKRAIMQSGTALATWVFQRNPMRIFNNVVMTTPCSVFMIAGTKVVIDCLKKLPPDLLRVSTFVVLGVKSIVFLGILTGLPLVPVLEKCSKTAALTEPTYRKLLRNNTSMVPMIVGINSEEALVINPYLFVKPVVELVINMLKGVVVPKDMYISAFDFMSNIKVTQKIEDYFFNGGLIITTASKAELIKFISDSYFIRQWRQYLTMVEKKNPTYCYIFSYSSKMGLDGKHTLYKGLGGVGHAEDLNYIFRRSYSEQTDFPKHDYVVRKRMVRMWTNFAKYGNPTPREEDVLQNITWHTSNYNGVNNCLDIGYNLNETQNFKEEEYTMWKQLYDTYGDPIDTY